VSAIKAATFILIPVQPSPYDIWATAELVDLVKARIEVMEGKLQAAFVVSRAIKGAASTSTINSNEHLCNVLRFPRRCCVYMAPCLQPDLPKLGARLGASWSRVAYSTLARQFSTCESKSFVNRLRDNLRLNVGSFLFRMLLAVVLDLVRFFHEQVLVKQTNAQHPQ